MLEIGSDIPLVFIFSLRLAGFWILQFLILILFLLGHVSLEYQNQFCNRLDSLVDFDFLKSVCERVIK